MHLVSTVTGHLAEGKTALDAVTACFPAGTLSGAPKVRAMELIEEVEKTRRGLYGGVLGYLDFAGNADFAIAIRTALMRDGTAYVQAGGGVVADSNGPYEYNEAANKARGGAQRDRRRGNADGAVTRVAQLLLVLSALALWVASRMTWVDVTSFDGLGQPKSTALSGATGRRPWCRWRWWCWRPRWPRWRCAAGCCDSSACSSRSATVGMGYLGIGLWVIRDVGVRAADLAQVPVTALIGTQRHYSGRRADAGGGRRARWGAPCCWCGRRPRPEGSPREVPGASGQAGGCAARRPGRRNVRADDLGRPRRGSGSDQDPSATRRVRTTRGGDSPCGAGGYPSWERFGKDVWGLPEGMKGSDGS